MDKKYACYCGLYCENCSVLAKIAPASKVLYDEMTIAGFDDIIHLFSGGDGFWSFLKGMAEDGICISCKEGSGNPACVVRECAAAKGVEMCAFCSDYPCEKFDDFFIGYPVLKDDNAVLKDPGWNAWAEIQDERRAKGYIYSSGKQTKE
jgi:hypothetical protein